jgi:hypothetical protein
MAKIEKVHGYSWNGGRIATAPCGEFLENGYGEAFTGSSDEITCKRCRKEIAEAMPASSRFGNVVDEIVGAKIRTAVAAAAADPVGELAWARDSFVRDLKSLRDRFAYMVEEADRLIERAERPESTDMISTATAAIELPTGVASNMATSSLVRDAAAFERLVDRVVEQVKLEDAAATAASLRG